MKELPRVGSKVRIPFGDWMVEAKVLDWFLSGDDWRVVVRVPTSGAEDDPEYDRIFRVFLDEIEEIEAA